MRTRAPFSQSTLLVIEIRNQGVSFRTDARGAYALETDGMGLSFVNVPASQLPILERWLSLSAENDREKVQEPRKGKAKPDEYSNARPIRGQLWPSRKNS